METQTVGFWISSPTRDHPNTKQIPAQPRNSVAYKKSVTDLPRKSALHSFIWDLKTRTDTEISCIVLYGVLILDCR
jgi:hypothetical protein